MEIVLRSYLCWWAIVGSNHCPLRCERLALGSGQFGFCTLCADQRPVGRSCRPSKFARIRGVSLHVRLLPVLGGCRKDCPGHITQSTPHDRANKIPNSPVRERTSACVSPAMICPTGREPNLKTRGQRAPHGTGSVYFDRANDTFVGSVTLGYASDGRRLRRTVRGASAAEVKVKLAELREDLRVEGDALKSRRRLRVKAATVDSLVLSSHDAADLLDRYHRYRSARGLTHLQARARVVQDYFGARIIP